MHRKRTTCPCGTRPWDKWHCLCSDCRPSGRKEVESIDDEEAGRVLESYRLVQSEVTMHDL